MTQTLPQSAIQPVSFQDFGRDFQDFSKSLKS